MSFLGAILGGIGGFLSGGPAGALIGAAAGIQAGSGGGGVASAASLPSVPYRTPIGTTMPGGAPVVGMAGLAHRMYGATFTNAPGFASVGGGGGDTSLPASDTGVMTAGASSDLPTGAAVVACNIKGHHLNKSFYVTKSHGVFGGLTQHAKGSTCVKNRRMNVGNARALRHALRRARGFEKLAMRTIHILHPKRRGSFGGFKTRRRR